MASDPMAIILMFLAASFLAFLVWLMYKESIKKEWQQISQGAKSERSKNEKN